MLFAPLVWAYLRWAYWWGGDPAPLAHSWADWVGLIAVLPLVPVYALTRKVLG